MLHVVPQGLEKLLSMAAAHEPFAQALMSRRQDVATAARVSLRNAERTLLRAISDERLRTLIDALRERQAGVDRRRFLGLASTAVMLMAVGSSALSCTDERQELRLFQKSPSTLGIRPGGSVRMWGTKDVRGEYITPKGVRLDWPITGSRVQVRVERLRITGPLHEKDFRAAIGALGPEISASYLISDPYPNPQGAAARIQLRIAAGGLVEHVGVSVEPDMSSETSFGDYVAVKSLERVLGGLRLPTLKAQAVISFELHLGLVSDPDFAKGGLKDL